MSLPKERETETMKVFLLNGKKHAKYFLVTWNKAKVLSTK